jgi:hypothetical protein
MDLNQFPSNELRTLQLAIAVAKQYSTSKYEPFEFSLLDKWNARIKDAIKDAEFEEQRNESNPRQCSLFQLQISQ